MFTSYVSDRIAFAHRDAVQTPPAHAHHAFGRGDRPASATAFPRSFSGISSIDAIRWAIRLGCQVRPVRRTGELRISHASLPLRVTMDARRKDCSRKLSVMLRHLAMTADSAAS